MGPKKITLEDLSEKIDERLDVFKKSLINELKNDILSDLKKDILEETSNLIKEKDGKIDELDSTVKMLQKQVYNLKQMCNGKMDDLEQYGRRQCLRIDGIAYAAKEEASAVMSKVKDLIKESGADIPDVCLDRAHRIGKPYVNRKTKVKQQGIIVKFSTFRHRTLFYRNRNVIKSGARIKIDLTNRRYLLLNKAREFIADRDDFQFAFADINCRLKIVSADDEIIGFDNISELNNILGLKPDGDGRDETLNAE